MAQINVERLAWLHDQRIAGSVDALLDPCINLQAAQAILLDCYQREQSAPAAKPSSPLHRMLSCYNAGDAATGFRNGYVQRVTRLAGRYTAARAPCVSVPGSMHPSVPQSILSLTHAGEPR